MKEEDKIKIIGFLESDYKYINKFCDYIKSHYDDVHPDFILYEDEAEYFNPVWDGFLKENKDIKVQYLLKGGINDE